MCATASAQPEPEPAEAQTPGELPKTVYNSRIGTTLPRGAWPGVSLEDVRGLRECTLDDPAFVVGSEVTCRPPVLPKATHLSFDLSWITGLVLDGSETRGVHGLAADLEWWVTRSIGLGARYAVTGIGTATTAMMEPSAIAGTGFLMARYRLFTDEVDRDAISIAVGGGFAMRNAELGREPVARLAIGRDIGYMVGERDGVTWAWELAAEQGLGDQRLRMVTAGVRAGFELGIREPENLRELDRDPPLRYSLGGEFRASSFLGLGATLGIPITRSAAWRTTAFWTTHYDDEGMHGLRATWAAVTGPRLLFTRGTLAPYLDVQAGPAAIGSEPATRFDMLAEAELGIDIHVGCQTTIDFGGRIQAELLDGGAIRTGFFIVRVEYGSALRRGGADACTRSTPFAN